MAEGLLKSFDKDLIVYSAGTRPEIKTNAYAIEAMLELGIDIALSHPKNVDSFVHTDFDYVITVCDNAKESCPVFQGKVQHRLHIGFEDPAATVGSKEKVMPVYRKVRDEIAAEFKRFYLENLI